MCVHASRFPQALFFCLSVDEKYKTCYDFGALGSYDGAMLRYVGQCWGYVGLCWAIWAPSSRILAQDEAK